MSSSFGSGGPRSPRGKPFDVDEIPALNTHQCHRLGAFISGAVTRLAWPHPIAPLEVVVRGESSRAFIRVGDGAELVVRVGWINGTLGGAYPLWLCPGCSVRRCNLYVLNGPVLLCRCCAGLDYRSRHVCRPAVLQVHRLRQRLVGRWIAPARRRRIIARLAAYEAQAFADLSATLVAVERRARSVKHERRNR